MKVEILAFSDYATQAGGKLTLVGVFDRLNAGSLPVRIPIMALSLKLRLEDGDLRPEPHKFVCTLLAPSKEKVVEVGGEMTTQRPPAAPNDPAEMGSAEFAFALPGATFKEYGRHVARLTVDGTFLGETPLFVVKRSK